jgi:hypothetical protein
MADTGYKSPGTAANDDAVGTEVWNNPDNIKTDDPYMANTESSPGETSNYLKATNFGFTIPTGSTIDGILVEIKRYTNRDTDTLYTKDSAVKIVKASGSIGTTNKGYVDTKWTTNSGYFSYGASDDLWEEIWTASDINNSNFGVVLSSTRTGTTGAAWFSYVEHIRIKVYYTELLPKSPLPTFFK